MQIDFTKAEIEGLRLCLDVAARAAGLDAAVHAGPLWRKIADARDAEAALAALKPKPADPE